MMLALLIADIVAASSRFYSRQLSKGQKESVEPLEKQIRAVEWLPRRDWINHDRFNIIDAFGLEHDEVEDIWAEQMLEQNLTQI